MMKLKKKVPKLFVQSYRRNTSEHQYYTIKSMVSASHDYDWFFPEGKNSSSRSKSSVITQADDISTSALSSDSAYEDSKNNSKETKQKSNNLTAKNIASLTTGGRRSRSTMYEFHKQMNATTAQQQSQLQSRQDDIMNTSSSSCHYHRRSSRGDISISTDRTPIVHNLKKTPPRTHYKKKKKNVSYSRQHQQQKPQKERNDHEGPVDVDAIGSDGSFTSGDEDEKPYFSLYNSQIIIRKDRRSRQPCAELSTNLPHFPLYIPKIRTQEEGRRKQPCAELSIYPSHDPYPPTQQRRRGYSW